MVKESKKRQKFPDDCTAAINAGSYTIISIMTPSSEECNLTIYWKDVIFNNHRNRLWGIIHRPHNRGAEPLTFNSVFGAILYFGGPIGNTIIEQRMKFSHNPPLEEIEKEVSEIFPKEPKIVHSKDFGEVVIDPKEYPTIAKGIKVLLDLWKNSKLYSEYFEYTPLRSIPEVFTPSTEKVYIFDEKYYIRGGFQEGIPYAGLYDERTDEEIEVKCIESTRDSEFLSKILPIDMVLSNISMMWFLLLSQKEKVMTPYEDHERKMDELLKDLQSGIITHEEFANNEIVKNHKAIRKERGKTVQRNAMRTHQITLALNKIRSLLENKSQSRDKKPKPTKETGKKMKIQWED